MNPRLAVAGLVVLACLATSASADAGEIGVDSSGWWQVGAATVITGAGLAEGELLIEGFGSDEGSRQAVAALSFRLDDTSTGVHITVPVSSSTPGASIAACAVTAEFQPVFGGPADGVPPHDCTRHAAGTIEDGNLVIADAGDLGGAGYIRVLLVPSQPGRSVVDGTRATLTTVAAPGHEVVADDAAFATPPPGERPTSTTVATGIVDAGAPIDDVVDAPGSGQDAVATIARPAAATTAPRFTPRPDDAAERLRTALVLGAALCLFTVLQRDSSRLRPRLVAWHRLAQARHADRKIDS